MMSTAIPVAGSIEPEVDTLIRRVAGGDPLAFETLYQQYTPRLMAYLQSRLDQKYLVEEVCQDVWMVVWKQSGQFQFRSRFSTWLFGIAQRLVWKARSRRLNAVTESLPMPVDEGRVESPEAALTDHHHQQQVALAIATLPLVLRQTITLYYYHNLSSRQVATQMGCAEVTARTRLGQAKRLLSVKLRRVYRSEAMAM